MFEIPETCRPTSSTRRATYACMLTRLGEDAGSPEPEADVTWGGLKVVLIDMLGSGSVADGC